MAAKYCETILVLLFCYMKVTWAEENFLNKYIKPGDVYPFNNPSYPHKYKPGTMYEWYFSTDLGYHLKLNCPEVQMPGEEDYCFDYLQVYNNIKDPEKKYCKPFVFYGPSIRVFFRSTIWWKGGNFKCYVTTEKDNDRPVINLQPVNEETCKCGWTPKAESRIIGGKDAEMNEFPSTVALVHKQKGLICTGTIITSNVVLSAAHCFIYKNYKVTEPKYFFIVAGEHDITKANETGAEQRINLSEIIIHNYYNQEKLYNDIALLKTAQEIQYSPKVGPACLPHSLKKADIMEQYLTASGWGRLRAEGPSPATLQTVQLQIVEDESCETFINDYKSSLEICTHTAGRSVCHGDSGGPLYYIDPKTKRYTIMGVTSSTTTDCISGPVIFQDVNKYLPWMKKMLFNDLCQKPKVQNS